MSDPNEQSWEAQEVRRQHKYERLEQESRAADRLRVQMDEALAAQRRQHFQLLVAHCTGAASQMFGDTNPGYEDVTRRAELLARKILELEP